MHAGPEKAKASQLLDWLCHPQEFAGLQRGFVMLSAVAGDGQKEKLALQAAPALGLSVITLRYQETSTDQCFTIYIVRL